MGEKINHFRELKVYVRAFEAAMNIYKLTKTFPAEERFALVDQIRRSSRSVCSNLAEAWRKRRYEAIFRNKITDAMQESEETQCLPEFELAAHTSHKRNSQTWMKGRSKYITC
jgi:four helix bundle protein